MGRCSPTIAPWRSAPRAYFFGTRARRSRPNSRTQAQRHLRRYGRRASSKSRLRHHGGQRGRLGSRHWSCSASETTVDGRSYDVFGQRTIFKPEPDRLINQGGGEADFHLLGLCGIWFAIIEQPLPTHSRLCGQHNYLHSYLGHFCETNPIWLTDGARSWMTPNLEELQLMI